MTELIFPTDYPLSPPKMKFVSEMFHPNGKKHYDNISPQEQHLVILNIILSFHNALWPVSVSRWSCVYINPSHTGG